VCAATSDVIPSGSELAGQTNLHIILVGSGVTETVMIAHTEGSELPHEVLVPPTEVVVLIIMQ
jgi:hypothetical protein